ncbi:DNA repair protein RAD5A [Camellia lanceoleosa]|uniref:DNA repair protein RAD5A n=1 Tax=Camellia lanceoleosa TaxID=1840588 RepID=A0ACC0F2Y4_9ERIC|nr:DNA repair protein RAD5A [Camellia lanceoleosa]
MSTSVDSIAITKLLTPISVFNGSDAYEKMFEENLKVSVLPLLAALVLSILLLLIPRWNKLIQKPFEEGDERGLKLVQSILRPIMLRRTKFSTDQEGRPILILPPADVQVIYCELTEAEKISMKL